MITMPLNCKDLCNRLCAWKYLACCACIQIRKGFQVYRVWDWPQNRLLFLIYNNKCVHMTA